MKNPANTACLWWWNHYSQNVTVRIFAIVYGFAESMSLDLSFLADTLYGPLHTKEAVKMFLGAVEQAKQQGGSVVYGGKVTYLYSPCYT